MQRFRAGVKQVARIGLHQRRRAQDRPLGPNTDHIELSNDAVPPLSARASNFADAARARQAETYR